MNFIFLLSTNFVENLLLLNFIFLEFNAVSSYYLCVMYVHIGAVFADQVKKYAPFIANFLWSTVSVTYLIVTYYYGNWYLYLFNYCFNITVD